MTSTPSHVTESLLRWGGKNPNGDPAWRIIRAEEHLVQRSGMWTKFADDTEQTHYETRGLTVHFLHRQIAPTAIRTGTRWVPLYQVRGWIMERWFPASAFGSRAQWESATSMDGTPMMGPYPENGGYFMPSGGGPWKEIPPLQSIRLAISQWENSEHSHGTIDPEALDRAVRKDCEAQEAFEDRQYEAFLSEVTYQRKSHLGFIKGNPALSGFRNRIARLNGLSEHV